MPETLYAYSFRHPLGNGLVSPENDGDGFYVAFGFDESNADARGLHHLGVDRSEEGLWNTDFGEPVHAIRDARVVSLLSGQCVSTTGFGTCIEPLQDLPE